MVSATDGRIYSGWVYDSDYISINSASDTSISFNVLADCTVTVYGAESWGAFSFAGTTKSDQGYETWSKALTAGQTYSASISTRGSYADVLLYAVRQ